jgi:predicted HicB family RNase H-like nuclease
MKDPKLTVRVSQEVYKRFRVKCFKNGQSVQEVLETAITSYLAEKTA